MDAQCRSGFHYARTANQTWMRLVSWMSSVSFSALILPFNFGHFLGWTVECYFLGSDLLNMETTAVGMQRALLLKNSDGL